jgi:hypothetical protein
MMFRGALVRLAAQYFVLLVLILGFFDLIVYVTVSQALQAKADNDLRHAVAQAFRNVTVTGDTVSANAQSLLEPSAADNLVRVLDYKGQEVGQPRAELKKLFNDPSLSAPIGAANAGRSSDTRVSYGTELYVVATRNPRRSSASCRWPKLSPGSATRSRGWCGSSCWLRRSGSYSAHWRRC